jgi:NADH dehydrogenase FAD-containing subunit
MLKNKNVNRTTLPEPQKDEEIVIVTPVLPATQDNSADTETITEEIEYSIDDTPSLQYTITGTVIRINTTKQTIIIEDQFHNGIELPLSSLNSHNEIGEQYSETSTTNPPEYHQKEEV